MRDGRCQECGRRVRWVRVRRKDGEIVSLPIDPEPTADGTVAIAGDGIHATVAGGGRLKSAQAAARLGITPLWTLHRLTCPARKGDV